MLSDNIAVLSKRFPEVYKFMSQLNDQIQIDHIEKELAKSGQSVLKIMVDQKQVYLHSKYDPVTEGERWIMEYDPQMNEYEHVFFYGVGLGYHIDYFKDHYPGINFTIYEPDIAIMKSCLETRSIQKFVNKRLQNFYVEYTPAVSQLALENFVNKNTEKVLLITHPVYERLFPEKTTAFMEVFKETIHKQRNFLVTNSRYEKLWLINSLSNFQKVLDTPSIFNINPEIFNGKPVMLVGAGPSLNEELEHIKYIKEHKLAFIISIGSANKALIANGIYPDAVTTYDPNIYNHYVFQEIIESKIDTIPMIFGSSVGYNTVNHYPGPLLHMVTNQDTVSGYYLSNEGLTAKGLVVSDAPTIAVITLEILLKLKCSPIILVGQNFGFKNDQYYSSGIEYSFRSAKLSEAEKANYIEVESVDGGTVKTFASHNFGRQQMERYLELAPNVEVINTTKGGAKIKGTTFVELEKLISDRLHDEVVPAEWYKDNRGTYNMQAIKLQAENLHVDYQNLPRIIDDTIKTVKKMNLLAMNNEKPQLLKTFPRLDKLFKSLEKNKFYETFVRPMVRLQYNLLQREIVPIRQKTDTVEKADKTVEVFGKYIIEVQKAYVEISKYYESLHKIVLITVQEQANAKTIEGGHHAN